MSDNTKITPGFTPASYVPVGGVILKEGNVNYNVGRPAYKLKVRNTGDRPVQVGSHLHFFEANRYLEFDHLPATTASRCDPGEDTEVEVVPFGGKRRIIGFNNLTDGYAGPEDTPSYYPVRNRAYRRLEKYGFKSVPADEADAEFTTTATPATPSPANDKK